MVRTKKPWLAAVFSLVIPGAGLAYLKMWKKAVLNFFVVQALIAGVLLFGRDPAINENFPFVVLALAAISAGIAHAEALRLHVENTDLPAA